MKCKNCKRDIEYSGKLGLCEDCAKKKALEVADDYWESILKDE